MGSVARHRRLVACAAVIDAALVVFFAVLGRATHGEPLDVGGVVATAWPFLAGAAAGWGACLAWRRPLSVVRTGVTVWVASVVVGMLVRVAVGEGTAVAFIVVAFLVLGLFLIGWRALAMPFERAAGRRAAHDRHSTVEPVDPAR